ncbi:MAG TPA: T9SS type A sorting domain-containing protein [Ignavibacteriaceae bacterium]|nr:T9SS type A sorting domain-containing protein [Ignavibacteriaceae bacterium]
MKLFNLLFVILFYYSFSYGQTITVNGRFTVVNMTASNLSVKLQINTNTGTADLGGATIVFSFDTTAILINQNPVKNVDYIYYNFCDGNYSPATVTRPMKNTVWVNIDLPYTNNNNGTIVAASPGWTDVVTIHFDIVDPNGAAHLDWQTVSPFWGIYDANNSTQWQTGVFEDLFGPLPVELVSFTATVLANQNILLEWVTASSLNNSGFEIERASFLTTPVQGWEMIGFVANQGNPTSLVEYSFTDLTAHSFPVVKYRLKSIDNDGSFQYSDIIEINTLPLSYELSQNYPNPFNPSTTINFELPIAGHVTLKIFNILGNEIATLVNATKTAGRHEINFDAAGLASGVYVYHIAVGDFSETKKMLLVR